MQQFALLTCYYFTNNLLIINKLYIFPALHTGRLMPIAELHLVQAVDHTNRPGKCWQINPNEVELVTHVVRPTCWQHWPPEQELHVESLLYAQCAVRKGNFTYRWNVPGQVRLHLDKSNDNAHYTVLSPGVIFCNNVRSQLVTNHRLNHARNILLKLYTVKRSRLWVQVEIRWTERRWVNCVISS